MPQHYYGWMHDEDIEAFLTLGSRVSLALWSQNRDTSRMGFIDFLREMT